MNAYMTDVVFSAAYIVGSLSIALVVIEWWML